jgi:hypothetical protein
MKLAVLVITFVYASAIDGAIFSIPINSVRYNGNGVPKSADEMSEGSLTGWVSVCVCE